MARRRVETVGCWSFEDADLDTLQRVLPWSPEPTPRKLLGSRGRPRIDVASYAASLLNGCPCDRCPRAHGCVIECPAFASYLRLPIVPFRRPAEVSGQQIP